MGEKYLTSNMGLIVAIFYRMLPAYS